ncbi:rod-binding protein [Sphingobium sp. H39-3-25]|uniref:rod-binding protein n=1 Tax=Sphingobium arseniciresistens TaxID=3030834 RepID=UPI0023BA2D85|nr:rod-binding protein [Sphingobium arseniciresistens]
MQMANISSATGAAVSTGTVATGKPAIDPALAKVAQQFEAIFMRQMIGAMRSASLGDGLTDSGASEQFRDMADARTADSMAQTGTFGIAQLLMNQFGGRTPATAAATALASSAITKASAPATPASPASPEA